MPIVRLADLLDQPTATAFLRGVVKGGRFANAYLFHGPPGVGKGTAALAFARALLCDRAAGAAPAAAAAPSLFDAIEPAAPADAPGAPLDDACGACAACARTATLQHPDLKFLFPVSGEESKLDETVIETVTALRDDPLFAFVYDKAASIRLSLTRDLLRDLAYHPFEAARRVVVVRDADRMREDQYSAMLKSLEEPGATAVWVLTTSRPNRLPATIRSRCQRVRFAPLAESTVRSFLTARAGVAADDARLLAALAAGNLTRALTLRDPGPGAIRDEAMALLGPAIKGEAGELWKAAQGFMRYGKTGRESLRRMIEFHELWLRDLLRVRYGAAAEMLANRDQEAELRRQAKTIDAREVRRRLMVLEEALRSIDGNVSADMTLFSAMARVGGRPLGEGDWPPHPAARWDY
ncbi:MAG: AAA family ATPase [Candidatus Eisenbacteria bacterium]|uniref:AAA family ATPase n=1 Tax=Eiseniibacteriota bacterium TaxID=2212470 RepID=A0A9D6QJA9_UNCEI|nr:AAA family ATPase [Candidatus Eisenbacteria bacterium]MBI3539045.1 AAA family ATPase [Candidatus Eisenbacteria bacterium]